MMGVRIEDEERREQRREELDTKSLLYDLERVVAWLTCQERHLSGCACSAIGTMSPEYVTSQAVKKITALSGIK